MAKTKKTTSSKVATDSALQRALELFDAASMSCGMATGQTENARADLASALRVLGYTYANESTDAMRPIKGRFMAHYGAGWLKGRGLTDNADAVRGVTLSEDAFKVLEGSAKDQTTPKGKAKRYREAFTSAALMTWRRAADDADPAGADTRKAEQAAKRAQAGKADKAAPKKAAPKKADKLAKVDDALRAALEWVVSTPETQKAFMAWAATAMPQPK